MRKHRALIAAMAALILTAGCEGGPPSGITPRARPAGLAEPEPQAEPSAASQELRTYYEHVQADLLAQGLLRQDGGGPDTPFTATNLARNFERIALYDEYARGAGLKAARDAPSRLRRWVIPVRVAVEFGPDVSSEVRDKDRYTVAAYVDRLARLTGHSITMSPSGAANFHVLVMTEDDRDLAVERIRELVPNITGTSLDIFRNLPRSIHCLVVAFSGSGADYEYRRAIALVRAEHPDLMRKSCYHEELAQGLGLANDSPDARPSIFNDDDEFALLTTHDEKLLRMLYDPRLRPGMTPDQARPVISEIAASLTGGPS